MSTQSNMKTLFLAFLTIGSILALAPIAQADQFNFSFSGGTISSSGWFTASPTATPGTYDITNIGGTFSDSSDGVSGAITGLYTPVSYSVPPAFTSGGFSFDDTFWPAGNSPHDCSDYPFYGGDFDVYGLVFNVAGKYEGGLWSDGNIPNVGLVYGAGDATTTSILNNPNQGSGVPVHLAISAAPEPGSMFLLALGSSLLIAAFRKLHPSFVP